jgi:hypothetical protein
LHPQEPSVPAPVGSAPGTGVRMYMKKAGQDLHLEEVKKNIKETEQLHIPQLYVFMLLLKVPKKCKCRRLEQRDARIYRGLHARPKSLSGRS